MTGRVRFRTVREVTRDDGHPYRLKERENALLLKYRITVRRDKPEVQKFRTRNGTCRESILGYNPLHM